MNRGLPDLIGNNMNIVFCGMAAGNESCRMNHYYAKSSNRFWNVLVEAGFIKTVIKPSSSSVQRESNYQILRDSKIGLTDLVKNSSGMDNEVMASPLDVRRLKSLIDKFQPMILAFNGKKAAKIFFNKNKVDFGLQDCKIGNTKFFVLPSTSRVAVRWWNQSFWREVCELIKNRK